MSETKIKVDKAKLIEAIKARRAAAEAEHNNQAAAYPEKVAEWQAEASIWLSAQRGHIERAEHVEDIGYRKNSPPQMPTAFDSSRFDRHIAMLEMSPDESVSVSTSDFGVYLR